RGGEKGASTAGSDNNPENIPLTRVLTFDIGLSILHWCRVGKAEDNTEGNAEVMRNEQSTLEMHAISYLSSACRWLFSRTKNAFLKSDLIPF
ncbi:hypothetical protein MWL79_26090, partial [Escherichia coli]|nr:hypothetical protein [Escherichia coli]